MDWTLAIDRNRDALLRVAAALFAMAGLVRGASVVSLPRQTHRHILRLLRPAESALRRLIVIAARDVSVSPRAATPMPAAIPRGDGAGVPAFALFDPRKRFALGRPRHPAGAGPRLGIPGLADPVFAPEQPAASGDTVTTERLCRRLQSLRRALDDLPGQARRLARWRARRNPGRVSPLRLGRPPGYRARPIHAVEFTLRDCHALARHVLAPP